MTGRYSSGPLRVGEYRIEAELPGFKRLVRQTIVLQVQETAVVNLQMELGTLNQETTVTAAEDLVRTTDASQGQVIEERRVKDLPLNGRDYLQLSLLSEGTLAPPGQGRTATGTNDGVGSRAGGFSAGGQRTTDNNYLLDGFDNNTDDTSFDTNQAEVIKPSVDAIQEFKVQTNAYSGGIRESGGRRGEPHPEIGHQPAFTAPHTTFSVTRSWMRGTSSIPPRHLLSSATTTDLHLADPPLRTRCSSFSPGRR